MKKAYQYIIHFFGYHRTLFLRIISGNTLIQLIVLAIIFCIVFGLLKYTFNYETGELFSFMTSFDEEREPNEYTPGELLYLIGVIFFSGYLVAVLTNGFRNGINRFESGEVRLSFMNHIIIFGYNDVALGIISESLVQMKSKKKYIYNDIVVIAEKNVSQIKEEIKGKIGQYRNIYVLHNYGLTVDDIKSFHPTQAKTIYIVGSSFEDVNIDHKNLKLLQDVGELLSKSNARNPTINIYLEHISSAMYLSSFGATGMCNWKNVNINVRNKVESWARRIIADTQNKYPRTKIARRRGDSFDATSSEKTHLFIFGMNEIGETVAISAAKLCHFPNYYTKGIKTRITIIDDDFGKHHGLLSGKYSDFLEFFEYEIKKTVEDGFRTIKKHIPVNNDNDIEWEFIESAQDDKQLIQYIKSECQNHDSTISIVICGNNESENYELAFNMPRDFFDCDIPIWLYTKSDYQLNYFLKETTYCNIIPWGMNNSDVIKETPEEQLSKLIFYFLANVSDISDKDPIEYILSHNIDWNKVDWDSTYTFHSLKDRDLYGMVMFCYLLANSNKPITSIDDNLLKHIAETYNIVSGLFIYKRISREPINTPVLNRETYKEFSQMWLKIILGIISKYKDSVIFKTDVESVYNMNYLDRKSFCKIYKGEKDCPYTGSLKIIWESEFSWLLLFYSVDISGIKDKYVSHGLKNFRENDGTPIELKAFIWYEYIFEYKKHDNIAFKHWYEDAMCEIDRLKQTTEN